MKIIESINTAQTDYNGCAVTIGNFDGVHLGHQEIIRHLCLAAEQRGVKSVAMTFHPHPVAILHPEKSPGVLTPLALKKQLLRKCGLDCLIVLKDSFELLNLSGPDFIKQFLIKLLSPSIIIEGDDFNFGYGRSGNTETLKRLSAENAFDVKIVPAKEIKISEKDKTKISSTLIRHLLHQGKVATAAKGLGRNYRLIGEIQAGRGKGAQLGFPTANINPTEQIIPAEGVYAGFVEIGLDSEQVCTEKKKFPAVFSIGRAKTFISDHPLLIEAHILDKTIENLYGKWLAMDFVKYIRRQQRFEDENRLTEQIARDCEAARHILAKKRKT